MHSLYKQYMVLHEELLLITDSDVLVHPNCLFRLRIQFKINTTPSLDSLKLRLEYNYLYILKHVR